MKATLNGTNYSRNEGIPMNRIEQIKAIITEYKRVTRMPYEVEDFSDEVEYLLSKLDIAEKALEQFTRGEFYRCTVENTWGPMVHMDKEPWTIAEEALKQLRE